MAFLPLKSPKGEVLQNGTVDCVSITKKKKKKKAAVFLKVIFVSFYLSTVSKFYAITKHFTKRKT